MGRSPASSRTQIDFSHIPMFFHHLSHDKLKLFVVGSARELWKTGTPGVYSVYLVFSGFWLKLQRKFWPQKSFQRSYPRWTSHPPNGETPPWSPNMWTFPMKNHGFSFRGCEKYQGDGSFFSTLGYFFHCTLWSIWKHIEGSCWDETCHYHQVYSWMVLLRVSNRQSDWGYSRYNCGIFCGEKCHFLSRLRLSRLNMDKPW